MAHAVHFSAVPNPYSFPCLCPVERLSIVVPRSSKHSPELTSRKPLGILVSLLNATLIGLLASVASKGVSVCSSPLDATLTKTPGAPRLRFRRIGRSRPCRLALRLLRSSKLAPGFVHLVRLRKKDDEYKERSAPTLG
jgi:hypothetical protein